MVSPLLAVLGIWNVIFSRLARVTSGETPQFLTPVTVLPSLHRIIITINLGFRIICVNFVLMLELNCF